MILKPLHAIAALSLLGASSTALAQSAAPLSVAHSPVIAPAGASLDEASDLRGPGLWIAGAVVLGLIVWGIIELTGDDDEDFPVSA